MLFIKYSTGKVNSLYTPNLKHNSMSLTSVVEFIMIDGDEAHFVKQLFGTYNGPGLGWNMSIPWNFKSQSQTYYGDLARTILANL